LNRAFAELSAEEKNSVSHRKRALEALKRGLKKEA
jgi:inosine/xanthosine triphosphate pyrophosphatase family protein